MLLSVVGGRTRRQIISAARERRRRAAVPPPPLACSVSVARREEGRMRPGKSNVGGGALLVGSAVGVALSTRRGQASNWS